MGQDILIQGGHVLDPASGKDALENIAVSNGKIVGTEEVENPKKIDASGYYVFPGFIDFHTHLFQGSAFGIDPDDFLPTGVTSAVDAGTTGILNFEELYRSTLQTSRLHLKAFLNMSGVGQPGGGINEPLDSKFVSWDRINQLLEQYKDVLLGVKLRISKPIVGDLGLSPLQEALDFTERSGHRLNVHVTNPPIPQSKLVSMFRPGDIFTHVFHGTGFSLLEKGKIPDEFWAARERGVIFDAANGRSNFSYEVTKEAIREGFLPDIISTDATALNYNQPEQVKNLPFVMSKYLSLGMNLKQVVEAVTATPARLMGLEGQIGTLQIGAFADVVICELQENRMVFCDSLGVKHYGEQVLVPVMVCLKGKIVYCRPDFA